LPALKVYIEIRKPVELNSDMKLKRKFVESPWGQEVLPDIFVGVKPGKEERSLV